MAKSSKASKQTKLSKSPDESPSAAWYDPKRDELANAHSTPEGDPSIRRKSPIREQAGRQVKKVPLTEKRMNEKKKAA